MLPKTAFINTESYRKLQLHFTDINRHSIRQLFDADPQRAAAFSLHFKSLYFDYSKNRINREIMELLCRMALECGLSQAIDMMFSGDLINEKENRAVLHTALRNMSDTPVITGGKDVMADVRRVRAQMKEFCRRIHSGEWKGYTGKRITDVVNIGIGGSDLGPAMVVDALAHYRVPGLRLHFVSNVDATQLTETLKQVNAETTLFLIASKTFTTQETMTNAASARAWFLQSAQQEKCIAQHFVALSTAKNEVLQFGIDAENMFEFWDWVGGRYSLWSAIGLSIALSIGYDNFEELLWGAYESDLHFRNEPVQKNIPAIMALIGLWYNNFYNAHTHAILPYDQYLHRFPAYMQQTDMESNGKSCDRNGDKVHYATGPVVWGEAGTNGQHAFYQLIHQGTVLIPCDFIIPAQSLNEMGDHHLKLISHCFAQSEALMHGKSREQVMRELQQKGKTPQEIESLLPYMVFDGNRPSNTFLIEKITPRSLGNLIALYEHKVFVQGVLWNIYSFDQWGVELGKKLALRILPELLSGETAHAHDASTNALIHTALAMRRKN